MRIHAIAGAAIYFVAGAGCSGELAQRPPANDPTSVAAEEAPFRSAKAEAPDPLLSTAPPTPVESPPSGTPAPHHEQGVVPGLQQPKRGSTASQPSAARLYTCPMHPDVRASGPGSCPQCGMTLVPIESKGGGR